jgi:hypothetical protein
MIKHFHCLYVPNYRVTFAYSRTPGFDPVLKPDYPVWANDLFGRQCPLCRNSVPILPTSFVDPDYAEPRDAIKFSVIPSTNTLNRYFWPADDHSPYFSLGQMRLELPGGACSNEGGFRPWILDNGTTLGY